MVNSEQFGKRLHKIMDEYDLNATSFADEIDVGRSSISHILSGRNKPSLEFVMKVIDAFPEVELYWLLNGKGSFPKKNVQQTPPLSSTPQAEQSYTLDFEQASTKPQVQHEMNPKAANDALPKQDESIERIVIFYKDGTFKSFHP